VRIVGGGGGRAIEDSVEALALELLSSRSDGLTLDRVEYEREGGQWFLRVFLDHPVGVTLDHCQEVARELGQVLDRVDPVPHAYSLEVSSPGIERPLRRDSDYDRFRGRLVTIRLYRAIGGRKTLTGVLDGLTPDGEIIIETVPGRQLRVPRTEVAKAHLAFDWSKVGSRVTDRTDADGSGPSGGGER
jgi:ribosome maturation factor RimP